MLKNTSRPALGATGSKWQMDAGKALKFDREEKLQKKKEEKKEKKRIQIKRTIQVPDEKPKTGNFIKHKNYLGSDMK